MYEDALGFTKNEVFLYTSNTTANQHEYFNNKKSVTLLLKCTNNAVVMFYCTIKNVIN